MPKRKRVAEPVVPRKLRSAKTDTGEEDRTESPPPEFRDKLFSKVFEGYGRYQGKCIGVTRDTFGNQEYVCVYDDGDQEVLTKAQVHSLIAHHRVPAKDALPRMITLSRTNRSLDFVDSKPVSSSRAAKEQAKTNLSNAATPKGLRADKTADHGPSSSRSKRADKDAAGAVGSAGAAGSPSTPHRSSSRSKAFRGDHFSPKPGLRKASSSSSAGRRSPSPAGSTAAVSYDSPFRKSSSGVVVAPSPLAKQMSVDDLHEQESSSFDDIFSPACILEKRYRQVPEYKVKWRDTTKPDSWELIYDIHSHYVNVFERQQAANAAGPAQSPQKARAAAAAAAAAAKAKGGAAPAGKAQQQAAGAAATIAQAQYYQPVRTPAEQKALQDLQAVCTKFRTILEYIQPQAWKASSKAVSAYHDCHLASFPVAEFLASYEYAITTRIQRLQSSPEDALGGQPAGNQP